MYPQTNLDTPGSGSPANPGAVVNQLAQAQENTLRAVRQQVADWNSALVAAFMTTFDNWALSVNAGRIPNTTPPQPPKGYVVGYFTDPTSGPGALGPYGETPVQWPYPMQGVDPVCPMPPIPEDLTQNRTQVAEPAMDGAVGSAINATDSAPVGYTMTNASGEKWTKQKFVTPFGPEYAWVRVS